MYLTVTRRRFLHQAVALGALSLGLGACGRDGSGASSLLAGGVVANERFPQGVASADPRSDSVILWTRVAPKAKGDPKDVPLSLVVAEDQEFTNVVHTQRLVARQAFDHTVRVLVSGLSAARTYYYRFRCVGGELSRLGRTRTAPDADTPAPLKVAVVSCQQYDYGFFGAYRHLLREDEAALPGEGIDLVLNLGDFIYENTEPEFHNRLNVWRGAPAEQRLRDAQGNPRVVRFRSDPHRHLAEDLDDYRDLYRTYLSDPDLQDCRAWFPFVSIWDDHEVFEDHWQSYRPGAAPGQRPIQRHKLHGNRAWFEYMPADLYRGESSEDALLSRFEALQSSVVDTPTEDFDTAFLAREENNLSVVESLRINRRLHWGSNHELFLVDSRSYRGPRGMPVAVMNDAAIGYPDDPVPPDVVRTLALGREANQGSPPRTLELGDREIENARRDLPATGILGARQKDWLLSGLRDSRARWKLITFSMPMMAFGFDARPVQGPRDGVRWADSWDGCPHARDELLAFLRANDVGGVVSLSGDRHGHFAGTVDAIDGRANRHPVIAEFAGAAVSGPNRFGVESVSLPERYRAYAGRRPDPGDRDETGVGLDTWLLYGAESARILVETADADRALASADPAVNPHLRYADNNTHGYFTAAVGDERARVEFIGFADPLVDPNGRAPDPKRRVAFAVKHWAGGSAPRLDLDATDGAVPPLRLKPA